MIKEGSLWRSIDDKRFRVMSVVDSDGHTWIHYRNEPRGLVKEPIREYSCYLESFELRFTKIEE